MIITRTPFRISFAGGGSDLPSFYRREQGAVLSTTINKYMYVVIHPFFNGNKIQLKYSQTELVDTISKIAHPIFREALSMYNLTGVDINSIADILTGKVCPSGRLTMTWPLAATDHPSTKNFPLNDDLFSFSNMKNDGRPVPGHDYTNHEEDIYVGYRYFDTFGRQVAYPFGYGLSYTTFDYSKPTAKVNGDLVTVSINVKNTGSMAGKEVAQVYVTAPRGSIEKPAKELKAFAKTRELQPGESETLTMVIPVRLLASYDEAGSQWISEAGTYNVQIGASIADIRATVPFKLAKTYTEETTRALKPQQKLNLLKQ